MWGGQRSGVRERLTDSHWLCWATGEGRAGTDSDGVQVILQQV